jgi:membrane-associated phospholipid phosphatase
MSVLEFIIDRFELKKPAPDSISPLAWETRESLSRWLLPSHSMKRRVWPLLVGLGYVALVACLGGLRGDHCFVGLLCLLDFYNEKTRKLLFHFFPFILTGVVFDSMRYFYWQGIEGRVHVSGPYFRDLAWFGINTSVGGVARRLTPNEFFRIHSFAPLDLLCGFAYLTFVGEYLTAAFYLFITDNSRLLIRFGWAFFTVNVLGFLTYFVYPAAPPWYVERYGLGPARMDVIPSAAAATRFDQILGTHFFEQVYGRGVDVYGAYPSLHVAYPFLTLLLVFQIPSLRWARLPSVAFYLLMCLSAVYLQHHYVVDILLGTTYALLVHSVFSRLTPSSSQRGLG